MSDPMLQTNPGAVHAPPAWPPLATCMPELMAMAEVLRRRPVLSLRQTIEQLGAMDARALDALERDEPELLRSRSNDLVRRLALTDEELGRALSRTEGLPEADLVRFDIEPDAFVHLPVALAQLHHVVPLGLAQGQLFVASLTLT